MPFIVTLDDIFFPEVGQERMHIEVDFVFTDANLGWLINPWVIKSGSEIV